MVFLGDALHTHTHTHTHTHATIWDATTFFVSCRTWFRGEEVFRRRLGGSRAPTLRSLFAAVTQVFMASMPLSPSLETRRTDANPERDNDANTGGQREENEGVVFRRRLSELPRWEMRALNFVDRDTGSVIPRIVGEAGDEDADESMVCWVEMSEVGECLRMISNPHKLPSRAYRNLSPKDFVYTALEAAKMSYDSVPGDVCVTGVHHDASTAQLMVTVKCPHTFSARHDPTDGFGTTMVLKNSYKQEGGIYVAAGAIRFACTNGSIFGDYKCDRWNHRQSLDVLGERVSGLLKTHADVAQTYIQDLTVREVCVDENDLKTWKGAYMASREWRIKAIYQEARTRGTLALGQLRMSWTMRKSVMDRFLRGVAATGDRRPVTKYDLWNACTNVCTHAMPTGRRRSTSTTALQQHTLLRHIDEQFREDGPVDQILDSSVEEFEVRRSQWIRQGWEKNWWTPIGPALRPPKRNRVVLESQPTTVEDALVDFGHRDAAETSARQLMV
jgi:hypothetical protein